MTFFFFLHMTLLNSSKLLHNITWPRTRRMDSSEFYITLSCTPQKPNSIHPSTFCPFSGFPRAPLPVLPKEHCPAKLCSLTTCPGSALQSTHAQNSYHSEGVLLECPQDAACIWDFFWGVFFGCDTKLMAVVESRNADQLLMPQQSVRPPPPLSCH